MHGVESRIHHFLLHSVEHPDVFLSYRWGPESDIVERVFNILTGPPFYLRVFWDKKCIPFGVDFKMCFAETIPQSAVFVPFISYDGVARRIVSKVSQQTDECDNVLLEWIINHAFRDDSSRRCVPLCIGDCTPGYPWNSFSLTFIPNLPAGTALPNPTEITTLHVNHTATVREAEDILARLRPAAGQEARVQPQAAAEVTVAEIWQWYSRKNAYIFSDRQLEAATVGNHANLIQLENAKYDEICVKIKSATDAVSRPPIQACDIMTQGGCLTILNDAGKWGAVAALGIGMLAALFFKLNQSGNVINVGRGSVILHFRLVTTAKSTMSIRQGYDQIEAWCKDGTLENEFGLGPLHFTCEDCIDESPLMLLHQQCCNF